MKATKAIVSIAAAVIILAALLAFVRNLRGGPAEVGPLQAGLEKLIADWTVNRVPLGRRVATLVLADSGAGAYEDPLALPPEPSAWSRLMSKVSSLFRGSPRLDNLPAAAPLAREFTGLPGAVVWTHEGFSLPDEAMTAELAQAIVKAHDAGAELNIVAQGRSAAPVYRALKGLEGSVRGGLRVGANKVVFVGMNEARFKRIPWARSYDFSRLGNVIELANMWTEDPATRARRMLLRAAGAADKEFEVAAVWPVLAGGGSVAELLRLVRELIEKVDSMAKTVEQQAQAVRDEAARRLAEEARRLEEERRQAEARAQEEARRRADAEAAIRRYEEIKRRNQELAARAAAEAARRKDAARQTAERAAAAAAGKSAKAPAGKAGPGSPASNRSADNQRHGAMCSKCCADSGGTWWAGSYSGNCADEASCQAFWGCCHGADFKHVESCQAATLAIGNCNYVRFRCAASGAVIGE